MFSWIRIPAVFIVCWCSVACGARACVGCTVTEAHECWKWLPCALEIHTSSSSAVLYATMASTLCTLVVKKTEFVYFPHAFFWQKIKKPASLQECFSVCYFGQYKNWVKSFCVGKKAFYLCVKCIRFLLTAPFVCFCEGKLHCCSSEICTFSKSKKTLQSRWLWLECSGQFPKKKKKRKYFVS